MGELFRSSWGIIVPRSSWGFTTLHDIIVTLGIAAALAVVAVVAYEATRRALRPPAGWGERGLSLLEAIIVLLIVAVVVLAIFVLV